MIHCYPKIGGWIIVALLWTVFQSGCANISLANRKIIDEMNLSNQNISPQKIVENKITNSGAKDTIERGDNPGGIIVRGQIPPIPISNKDSLALTAPTALASTNDSTSSIPITDLSLTESAVDSSSNSTIPAPLPKLDSIPLSASKTQKLPTPVGMKNRYLQGFETSSFVEPKSSADGFDRQGQTFIQPTSPYDDNLIQPIGFPPLHMQDHYPGSNEQPNVNRQILGRLFPNLFQESKLPRNPVNPSEDNNETNPLIPNGKENPKKEEKKEDKQDKDKEDKDKKDKDKEEDKGPKWFNIHGQGTIIDQGNWAFHSPYQGPLSFRSGQFNATSETATLYVDTKLWEGADFVFNPEVAGGYGLSFTNGIAGFPNGEITRVGLPQPTPYIARAHLRQVFALGDETEDLEDGPNQLAGKRAIRRFTVNLGKMAFIDQFDDNRYSHDPRTGFMNWALMYNGAWDYPANVRGYTYGGSLEWNEKNFALRYGLFGEPLVANGAPIDPHFLKAQGQALELELRYNLWGRPGKVRMMGFLNHANMGNYDLALREQPVDPNIIATRSYRFKYGYAMNTEQEIFDDLGIFTRLGWNDGHTESWAFTEIDRTAAIGMVLRGDRWRRPMDNFGLAFLVNGLSRAHREYLGAGGLGFIIGDGRINYAPETIVETYYSWQPKKGIIISLDFQGVSNPAYNRDRGPVAIMGVRTHFEY